MLEKAFAIAVTELSSFGESRRQFEIGLQRDLCPTKGGFDFTLKPTTIKLTAGRSR
jgi:hypothetical protein